MLCCRVVPAPVPADGLRFRRASAEPPAASASHHAAIERSAHDTPGGNAITVVKPHKAVTAVTGTMTGRSKIAPQSTESEHILALLKPPLPQVQGSDRDVFRRVVRRDSHEDRSDAHKDSQDRAAGHKGSHDAGTAQLDKPSLYKSWTDRAAEVRARVCVCACVDVWPTSCLVWQMPCRVEVAWLLGVVVLGGLI